MYPACVLWGVGTAIGEIPPYVISRAAAKVKFWKFWCPILVSRGTKEDIQYMKPDWKYNKRWGAFDKHPKGKGFLSLKVVEAIYFFMGRDASAKHVDPLMNIYAGPPCKVSAGSVPTTFLWLIFSIHHPVGECCSFAGRSWIQLKIPSLISPGKYLVVHHLEITLLPSKPPFPNLRTGGMEDLRQVPTSPGFSLDLC